LYWVSLRLREKCFAVWINFLRELSVKNPRVLCGSSALDFFAPSRLCEKYYFVWINFLRELRVKNLSVLCVLCGSFVLDFFAPLREILFCLDQFSS
jgi:hypothetical protein